MGHGGGGHWLVRMEWRPAGWSVCLPLLIFPCTITSKFSSGTGSPGWSRKKGRKTVVVWCLQCTWLPVTLADGWNYRPRALFNSCVITSELIRVIFPWGTGVGKFQTPTVTVSFVQGHSGSLLLMPIDRSHMISYSIVTCLYLVQCPRYCWLFPKT